MLNKIDEAKEDFTVFDKKMLLSRPEKRQKAGDFLSSLYLDTETKNRELLTVVKKLKTEEEKNKDAYMQLITALVTALESKSPYTEGHTRRVCEYSLLLANELNLSDEEKDRIQKGALLHDLGKIGTPDAILEKKGSLTDEEFAIIKEHEVLSAKILEPIKGFKDIIPYVIHHHESFDGSGYPHGLAGDFIPLGARIITVADVFDALTTGRSYKKAFSVKAAVEELVKMKGAKLDPILADKFIEALKKARILT